MIVVEGSIFAFRFSKKYDLSLLSMEGQVTGIRLVSGIDRLVSVLEETAPCLYL
jgi:hypothetical protein